jgi:threonyl-tRNA synthetase
MQRVPYLLIVGAKEEASDSISVRTQKGDDLGIFPLQELSERLRAEAATNRSTPE